jgi:hypothetical protein
MNEIRRIFLPIFIVLPVTKLLILVDRAIKNARLIMRNQLKQQGIGSSAQYCGTIQVRKQIKYSISGVLSLPPSMSVAHKIYYQNHFSGFIFH